MPSKCSVHNCPTSSPAFKCRRVTVFSYPKNTVRRQDWMELLGRTSEVKDHRVCEVHFEERYILRDETLRRPDGSVLILPKERAALTHDARPTLLLPASSHRT